MSLNSVKHSVADLARINLEDLDAIVLDRGGCSGGGESLHLDEAHDGGGLVAWQGAVALGENGLPGERLDEARHHGVACALCRWRYAVFRCWYLREKERVMDLKRKKKNKDTNRRLVLF